MVLYNFLSGAAAFGFFVCSLFFLRFWRHTRDRLFGLFAFAFFAMSINRLLIGFATPSSPVGDRLYWIRLVAFGLILLAILDKNRSHGRSRP